MENCVREHIGRNWAAHFSFCCRALLGESRWWAGWRPFGSIVLFNMHSSRRTSSTGIHVVAGIVGEGVLPWKLMFQ